VLNQSSLFRVPYAYLPFHYLPYAQRWEVQICKIAFVRPRLSHVLLHLLILRLLSFVNPHTCTHKNKRRLLHLPSHQSPVESSAIRRGRGNRHIRNIKSVLTIYYKPAFPALRIVDLSLNFPFTNKRSKAETCDNCSVRCFLDVCHHL
jgi:hypothetical protein